MTAATDGATPHRHALSNTSMNLAAGIHLYPHFGWAAKKGSSASARCRSWSMSLHARLSFALALASATAPAGSWSQDCPVRHRCDPRCPEHDPPQGGVLELTAGPSQKAVLGSRAPHWSSQRVHCCRLVGCACDSVGNCECQLASECNWSGAAACLVDPGQSKDADSEPRGSGLASSRF